jgi:cysteine-rich repeat protein
VCIQKCNARAGDQAALISECVSSTCGNGQLEYGETCDDGNRTSGDGCNEFCSLSTFVRCANDSDCPEPGQKCGEPAPGQGLTYCLPPLRRDEQGNVVPDPEKDEREDKDKYRTTCMEFEYCWPPDDRADWLGKKREEVRP